MVREGEGEIDFLQTDEIGSITVMNQMPVRGTKTFLKWATVEKKRPLMMGKKNFGGKQRNGHEINNQNVLVSPKIHRNK